MKKLFKLVIGIVLICVIAGVGYFVFTDVTHSTLKQTTLESILGSENYSKAVEIGNAVGIDLKNDTAIQNYLTEHPDQAEKLKDLAEKVESGALSVSKAAPQMEKILGVGEAG